MLKEYFTVSEIKELKLEGYSTPDRIHALALSENWLFRTANSATKPYKEYHISNFPASVREKIINKLLEQKRENEELAGLDAIEKTEKEAYARFEIIHYVISNKLKKEDFVEEYNNKQVPLTTYSVISAITSRTLYRWIKSYEKEGIEGLKSKASKRRLGKVKSMEVKELVEGVLLEKPHLKIATIYDFLVAKAKKEGFKVPSYKTVVLYINKFKNKNKAQFLLASNPDKFKSKYMLAIGSYSEEAIEPNYIWEVDSTPADIMLSEGRCTILGCVDIYTRRVKFLVQKSSNSLGITSLLRNCIIDWGVPKIIKSDNGKDYKSKHVEIALKKLGIEQRFTNPYSGWEKPFVERVFRTAQHSHLEAHKDFIGHNVAERKAIESVKTFAERLLNKQKEFPEYSIEDLQRFLNIWVDSYYLNRKHQGLLKYVKQHKLEIDPSPNSMLEYSLNKGFKKVEPTSTRDLDLLLEPLSGKRTIGKKGIWVENNAYFNPSLAVEVGNQVIVRVDRVDRGKIYVFDEAHNFICEAFNYELLGDSKQEFIRKGKLIQNELTKAFKKKTKVLIGNSKKALEKNYRCEFIMDIEEVIANAEKKGKLNGNYLEEVNYQELIEEKIDEGEERYQKFKALELQIERGEIIDEEDLIRLENYQKTGEYISKKFRDLNLEEFKNKQAKEFDTSSESKSNSITNS